IDGYQHREYVLKLNMNGFEDAVIFLDDNFNQNATLFVPGETEYFFEIDPNNSQSLASDRFQIRVEHRLNTESVAKNKMVLYPNPMNDHIFFLKGWESASNGFHLTVRDIEGRQLFERTLIPDQSEIEVRLPFHLQTGLYFVEITSEGMQQQFKLLKN